MFIFINITVKISNLVGITLLYVAAGTVLTALFAEE